MHRKRDKKCFQIISSQEYQKSTSKQCFLSITITPTIASTAPTISKASLNGHRPIIKIVLVTAITIDVVSVWNSFIVKTVVNRIVTPEINMKAHWKIVGTIM